MKRLLYTAIFPLVALMALAQGCIKDSLDDCPTGITVRLWHDPVDDVFALPASDVATLLVFDADGTYRESFTQAAGFNGTNEHIFKTPLPKGHYTFVGFRALRDCFATTPQSFVPGQTTIDEAIYRLQYVGSVTTAPHHLFSSEYVPVEVVTKSEHFDVYMPQVTNLIVLRSENMPASADNFSLAVKDNNSHYKLDNSFSSCQRFDYIDPCTKDGDGQIHSSLTVLRLADGRHPDFIVTNVSDDSTLFQADLVELIKKIVPGVDFERDHYFEIVLRFDIDMNLTVVINGWAHVVDDF